MRRKGGRIMPRKSTLPPDAPVWLTEDRRIDEMTFCCSFICDWVKSGTARKVEDLLKAVRMMAFADELPLHQDRIHVSNGTWYLDDHFSEEKEYCRNRLEVAYNSAAGIANVWLNFLSESFWSQKISRPCRSTWDIACFLLRRPRRCS